MAVPVLQALLVADQIYQDQSTGKFVICGIFGTIFFLPGGEDSSSAAGTPPARSDDAADNAPGAGPGAPAEIGRAHV